MDVGNGKLISSSCVVILAGVWFMHCHLEVHMSWGLKMAWLVLDDSRPEQKLPPPPADLPKC
jgi:laccase